MNRQHDGDQQTRGAAIDFTGAVPAIYLVPPIKGSGPAVIILAGGAVHDGAARDLCKSLGQEGYLALAPLGDAIPDLPALVARARAEATHCGKLGVVAFAGAWKALLSAGSEAGVDCAVIYSEVSAAGKARALAALPFPVTLHLAGDTGAAARPDAGPSSVYTYPGAAAGFAQRDSAGHDPHLAGLAYSRTVRALKRAMGPHYNLEELWDYHLACEFVDKDAEAAMRTMVPEPYVNHIPTLTGGVGYETLKRFYRYHFVDQVPSDRRTIPISQTVGDDRIVDEKVFCFTHDCAIDWLLPGVAPTGRYVEIPLVGIVTFRGDKLVNEHIYWDQASVLVQIGLLDPAGLPVAGREQARKLLDKTLPSNELMPAWADSARLPLDD